MPVRPPDWPALTESSLCGTDASASGFDIAVATLGIFERGATIHEFSDKLMTSLFRLADPESAGDTK